MCQLLGKSCLLSQDYLYFKRMQAVTDLITGPIVAKGNSSMKLRDIVRVPGNGKPGTQAYPDHRRSGMTEIL